MEKLLYAFTLSSDARPSYAVPSSRMYSRHRRRVVLQTTTSTSVLSRSSCTFPRYRIYQDTLQNVLSGWCAGVPPPIPLWALRLMISSISILTILDRRFLSVPRRLHLYMTILLFVVTKAHPITHSTGVQRRVRLVRTPHLPITILHVPAVRQDWLIDILIQCTTFTVPSPTLTLDSVEHVILLDVTAPSIALANCKHACLITPFRRF